MRIWTLFFVVVAALLFLLPESLGAQETGNDSVEQNIQQALALLKERSYREALTKLQAAKDELQKRLGESGDAKDLARLQLVTRLIRVAEAVANGKKAVVNGNSVQILVGKWEWDADRTKDEFAGGEPEWKEVIQNHMENFRYTFYADGRFSVEHNRGGGKGEWRLSNSDHSELRTHDNTGHEQISDFELKSESSFRMRPENSQMFFYFKRSSDKVEAEASRD